MFGWSPWKWHPVFGTLNLIITVAYKKNTREIIVEVKLQLGK